MTLRRAVSAMALAGAILVGASYGQNQEQSQQSAAARPVGTLKAINGNNLTVATSAGASLSVVVNNNTRILRLAPGQKDLKDATLIKLEDLQVGDRMIIRGRPSDDVKSITASSLLVMKKTDIQERQTQEREDWQKRGVGGLVNAIDLNSGNVTLSTSAPGANKTIVVHVSKDTIVRRYAPGSVRFEDAKPGSLDQIKPGDQLCARGNRDPDGTELAAEEIVSGSFRNIAGTVLSTAPEENTIRIMDVLSKNPVTVRVTSDSQLKKLPPMLAQRIAVRMKGESPPSNSAPPTPTGDASRPRGTGDLQQLLGRLPQVTVGDLQKGDAVMLVTSAGSSDSALNVITLLTGVEPILTAAPNGQGAAMLLSPWNLGSSAGEGASE